MFYFAILMIKNGTIITFFEKKCKNICTIQKKAVPLHSLLKNEINRTHARVRKINFEGRLAQLV